MSHLDKGIMTPVTAQQMVEVYEQTAKKAIAAIEAIQAAEEAFSAAFGRYFPNINYGHGNSFVTPDELRKKMRQKAWDGIVDKLELRKVLPTKRWRDLEDAIEKDTAGEITVENIFNLLATVSQNSRTLHNEIVREAYEVLRPSGQRAKEYKSNSEFEVAGRVILTYCIRHTYGLNAAVEHYHEKDLLVIDKAFHLLAGKGIPDGYRSPLIDAINTTEFGGEGETEFFKFRPFHNGNLHLWFKDEKLLQEFNRIAGAEFLRPQ
jgi:hypothetical protein